MSVTDDDQFVAYGGANYDYLAMGPSRFGFVTMASGNDPNFRVGCSAGGNIYGVFGYAGPGRDDGNTVGPATNTYTSNAGVYGASLQFTGVAGAADALQPGVYGQCGDVSGLPPGLTAGVLGASTLAAGVHGWSQTDHGVEGESDTSTGVWGASKRSYGVSAKPAGSRSDHASPTRTTRWLATSVRYPPASGAPQLMPLASPVRPSRRPVSSVNRGRRRHSIGN